MCSRLVHEDVEIHAGQILTRFLSDDSQLKRSCTSWRKSGFHACVSSRSSRGRRGWRWCGHAWSDWVPSSDLARCTVGQGLYRICCAGQERLLYIGQGSVSRRQAAHTRRGFNRAVAAFHTCHISACNSALFGKSFLRPFPCFAVPPDSSSEVTESIVWVVHDLAPFWILQLTEIASTEGLRAAQLSGYQRRLVVASARALSLVRLPPVACGERCA